MVVHDVHPGVLIAILGGRHLYMLPTGSTVLARYICAFTHAHPHDGLVPSIIHTLMHLRLLCSHIHWYGLVR